MKELRLPKSTLIPNRIRIPGSKSETNRLLILQALFPGISIDNPSNSDDSAAMREALQRRTGTIDIGHAGTAMRFLTAFYAASPGADVILTGSERMKQRPVGLLVDALLQLGADIAYVNEDGFPPLRIRGRRLVGGSVEIPAHISSQYITALMLIAPSMPEGLTIKLHQKITSAPYIAMTHSLMSRIGIKSSFDGRSVSVNAAANVKPQVVTVESDWSAASYFYSIVALSEVGSELELTAFSEDSIQGDRALSDIFNLFGVATSFDSPRIVIRKVSDAAPRIELDLNNTPDIAQSIAVTSAGLGIDCVLRGLHTLPIKETDRIAAMKSELEKFGATVTAGPESMIVKSPPGLKSMVSVDTYADHRMAMSFAALAVKVPLIIRNPEVVSKSYPLFWADLAKIGIAG